MSELVVILIRWAGFGQIAVAAGSLAIPRVLGWAQETGKLRPLTRQVFWMYAAYILGMNLSLGLLSAVGAEWLADGSPLAAAVTGFITLYWGARLASQFLILDRRDAPRGAKFVAAEIILVSLFMFFTSVFGWAVVENLRRLA